MKFAIQKKTWAFLLTVSVFVCVLVYWYTYSKRTGKTLVNGTLNSSQGSEVDVLKTLATRTRQRVESTVEVGNPSLESNRISKLKHQFDRLFESSRYFNASSLSKEIYQDMMADPEHIEVLVTILKSKNRAVDLFGDKQAEARVLGIRFLSFLYHNDNPSPLLEVLNYITTDPEEGQTLLVDEGRREDLRDLVAETMRGLNPEKLAQ